MRVCMTACRSSSSNNNFQGAAVGLFLQDEMNMVRSETMTGRPHLGLGRRPQSTL